MKILKWHILSDKKLSEKIDFAHGAGISNSKAFQRIALDAKPKAKWSKNELWQLIRGGK